MVIVLPAAQGIVPGLAVQPAVACQSVDDVFALSTALHVVVECVQECDGICGADDRAILGCVSNVEAVRDGHLAEKPKIATPADVLELVDRPVFQGDVLRTRRVAEDGSSIEDRRVLMALAGRGRCDCSHRDCGRRHDLAPPMGLENRAGHRRVSGLFVISRNSTFIYKGKSVPTSPVSEELGVRSVLDGSVQRAGNQLRINARPIDALSGCHAWADRFDGPLEDVLALQDKVTRARR